MTPVPINDDQLLSDVQLSAAFAARGIPVAVASLKTMVTRGGGPPYRKFGRHRLYRWGDALDWAQGRLSKPVRSSSELPPQAEPPRAA